MTLPAEDPRGIVATRAIAMPAAANPWNHIFGGWLMSQMDLAGGTTAQYRAKGRVATVAVDAMTFHAPVFVGDELTCYAKIVEVGYSSIRVAIEAWVRRCESAEEVKVTAATFVFVAIDENRRPRAVPHV